MPQPLTPVHATKAASGDPQLVVAALVGGIRIVDILINPSEGATWQLYSGSNPISEPYDIPVERSSLRIWRTAPGEALNIKVQGGPVSYDLSYIEV
jgi:hypothetical protein